MTEPSPSDTIFQVLAHDHRDLEARFAQLHELAVSDVAAARNRYPQLATAILVHLHAEAAVLMPRLALLGTLDGVLERSRVDHERLEADVQQLAHANLTPSEWLRGLRRLDTALEHLIEREEADVFPVARRALPIEESHQLARDLRTAEQRELDR